MDAMIKLQNVEKSYGTHKAVNKLSLQVQRDSFFSFLGPNGAGKSTTIAMLSTLLKKDAGNIYIDGLDMDSDAVAIRSKIGIVFQNCRMDGMLNGYENLQLRCGLYSTIHNANQRVEELADMCQLKSFLYQRVDTLSGGQRRRLDIARALLPNPALFILDEPTTGLDPCSRKEIWDMIMMLKERYHMTIFLTTHDMEEAKHSDQLAILLHGSVRSQGSVQELTHRYVSDRLYVYGRQKKIIEVLQRRHAHWQLETTRILIHVTSTQEALAILHQCELYIDTFEMIHGNLEEAYRIIVKEGEQCLP